MNLTFINTGKTNLRRVAHCACALALVLGSSCFALAQEPDGLPQTNSVPDTNIIMQVEEVSRLLNDLMPPEDSGATNGVSPELLNSLLGSDNAGSNSASNVPSATEPRRELSGRESRSQRFDRERASRSARGSISAASSPETGAAKGPASLDYSAFRLVADRNIFNPNRFRRQYQAPPQGRSRDQEYFALVGTMSYEKGTFAFFTSASSSYQKVLKLADTIAGYKLTAITADAVKLARETNEVQLTVGMQMRRDEDGGWQPAKAPVAYVATGPAPSASVGTVGPAPATQTGPAPSGAESDIIKRMMQRREQE